MFLEILVTLLQALSVFSILLVAFGLAFSMLLQHEVWRHWMRINKCIWCDCEGASLSPLPESFKGKTDDHRFLCSATVRRCNSLWRSCIVSIYFIFFHKHRKVMLTLIHWCPSSGPPWWCWSWTICPPLMIRTLTIIPPHCPTPHSQSCFSSSLFFWCPSFSSICWYVFYRVITWHG